MIAGSIEDLYDVSGIDKDGRNTQYHQPPYAHWLILCIDRHVVRYRD